MTLSDYTEGKLIELGATPEYTGYKYLLNALMMTMQDESMLSRVTTGLYPAIAEKFGTSPANVERSIRTVLSAVWCDADKEALKNVLGRSYSVQPGNAKFIGIVSKRLLMGYRKERYLAKTEGAAAKG